MSTAPREDWLATIFDGLNQSRQDHEVRMNALQRMIDAQEGKIDSLQRLNDRVVRLSEQMNGRLQVVERKTSHLPDSTAIDRSPASIAEKKEQ